MLITCYEQLMTSLYKTIHYTDIILVEGVHLSGKTYIVESLKEDLVLPVYSTWESMGGRKPHMSMQGITDKLEGYLHLHDGYFFALDMLAQLKKQKNRALPTVILDRGHLSTAFYSPKDHRPSLDERIRGTLNFQFVLVEPNIDQVLGKRRKEILKDSRINSIEEYLTELRRFRQLFEQYTPERRIILENIIDESVKY